MRINDEQLEAEMDAGLHEQLGFVVSRTTLAHLVFASQIMLREPHLKAGSAAIFRAFVRDAVRVAGFPPQTLGVIEMREKGA